MNIYLYLHRQIKTRKFLEKLFNFNLKWRPKVKNIINKRKAALYPHRQIKTIKFLEKLFNFYLKWRP
jgi:hypothetical protein